jgi:hypothetical protein
MKIIWPKSFLNVKFFDIGDGWSLGWYSCDNITFLCIGSKDFTKRKKNSKKVLKNQLSKGKVPIRQLMEQIYQSYKTFFSGATTLSITTFSLTTLSIMTFSITTLSITFK